MTSEGLGEMIEGDFADICVKKIPLMLMGGQAECLVSADTGARTPIGVSRNFRSILLSSQFFVKFCQLLNKGKAGIMANLKHIQVYFMFLFEYIKLIASKT